MELKAQGVTVNQWRLREMERYKALHAQTVAQFNRYASYADGYISDGQREIGHLGIAHSQQAIQLSYWPRVDVTFNRLPFEAVENMVGLAGNGQPLGELLKQRMVMSASGEPLPDVWDRLTRTLVESTAIGRNPRQTATLMRDDLAGGLQKALTIARTEQLRVYRQLHADSYAASNVVRGQKRLTAHDGRVCAACLADEGTIYSVYEILPDHVMGRCTSVPVLDEGPQVDWLSGEDWLKTQPIDVQQAIMGKGRWEAYNRGEFAFGDIVRHTHDSVWGGGIGVRNLSDLVARQTEYYESTAVGVGGEDPRVVAETWGATQAELQGISFSHKPLAGYSEIDSQTFRSGDGRRVGGVYSNVTRTVHVPPNATSATIMHEVGHHATMNRYQRLTNAVKAKFKTLKEERNYAYRAQDKHTGLRDYSYKDHLEFMADSYMVLKIGSLTQRKNLIEFVKSYAGVDLTPLTQLEYD